MRGWLWLFIICSSRLIALPTVVPDPIACVKDLETHFFDEFIVNRGLSLYDIRQELWVPINASLQRKSLEVPERMKKRTARMVPNPIEYPLQRVKTAKILKDLLFEVFLEAMRENWSNERPTADFVFDYIYTQQLPNFVRCFGEEILQEKNP